jgi:hypothetical protein
MASKGVEGFSGTLSCHSLMRSDIFGNVLAVRIG